MPCNIGYKSYAKIEIPEPVPQTFKQKSEAPAIDESLLARLGIEDPEFLEWLEEFDTMPLLQEALKRTLAKMGEPDLKFAVTEDGMLEAQGSFVGSVQKSILSQKAGRVSERWQFEILGIVADILGYTVKITQTGNELILEAEEKGKSHPCDYIKVTKKDGDISLTFEHFKSRKALAVAMAKFLALADKLGVKIKLGDTTISEGDAFPEDERHAHSHSHGHHHHDDDGHSHDS